MVREVISTKCWWYSPNRKVLQSNRQEQSTKSEQKHLSVYGEMLRLKKNQLPS